MAPKTRLRARLEGTLLTSLPLEVLSCILAALPVADQWRLAGTCKLLRTLVLDQAERITVRFGAVSNNGRHIVGISAPLLAAVRRQHGKFCLRLIPQKQKQKNKQVVVTPGSHQAAGGQYCSKQWLKALGQCPAVDKLELKGLAVSNSKPNNLLNL
jgi:hypothetical protein